MSDFITLTCPSCGGKLKVTDQIHLLACRNCGNEHMVHRDGGSIYLAPLVQDVRHIRVGVDKTAAELAVARLTKEVADLAAASQSAQARDTDDWIPPNGWEETLRTVALIAFILTDIAAFTGGGGFTVLMAFVFVAFLIPYSIVHQKRFKAAAALENSETQRLFEQLSDKSAALTRNRRIAES